VISGQLGTAQLGLAQLGQYESLETPAAAPPVVVVAPVDEAAYRWFEPSFLAHKILLEAAGVGEGLV
jgi:hypothetical protein